MTNFLSCCHCLFRHLFDSLIFCLLNPQKTARPHQNRSDMLTSGSDELVICGTHLMLYNYAHINEELPKIYICIKMKCVFVCLLCNIVFLWHNILCMLNHLALTLISILPFVHVVILLMKFILYSMHVIPVCLRPPCTTGRPMQPCLYMTSAAPIHSMTSRTGSVVRINGKVSLISLLNHQKHFYSLPPKGNCHIYDKTSLDHVSAGFYLLYPLGV